MTRATLRTRVQERVSAAGAAPYTVAQIDSSLNEGLILFGLLTLCVERRADLVLRANEPVRRILETWPDFLAPLRVECARRTVTDAGSGWDSNLWDSALLDAPAVFTELVSAVRPTRLRELGALDPGWRLARDGTVERYALQGLDVLCVYPAPADANTALRMTFAAQPQLLTVDDQEPEIPQEYHPALGSYALCTLALSQGGSELARFANEWRQYLAAARECAAWVRSRARGRGYDSQPLPITLPEPKKAGSNKP